MLKITIVWNLPLHIITVNVENNPHFTLVICIKTIHFINLYQLESNFKTSSNCVKLIGQHGNLGGNFFYQLANWQTPLNIYTFISRGMTTSIQITQFDFCHSNQLITASCLKYGFFTMLLLCRLLTCAANKHI